jgi:hypothetical protein
MLSSKDDLKDERKAIKINKKKVQIKKVEKIEKEGTIDK